MTNPTGPSVDLSMSAASGGSSGYLTASDFNIFSNKVGSLTAGTGITLSGPSSSPTITNSAPDQTVAISGGTGISATGTYPNFTVTNTAPDQTVSLTAGTGISATGTYPNFTVTNTAPDQTVSLTAGSNIAITGSYPSFTIGATGLTSGTVTSVGSGTGLTGGPITSSGTLSLANTSVTPGSYTLLSATVDAQGRIIAASNGSAVTSVTGTSPIVSSGGATPAISLANSGVTAATYTNATVTVNAQGLITSASSGSGVTDRSILYGFTRVGGSTTRRYISLSMNKSTSTDGADYSEWSTIMPANGTLSRLYMDIPNGVGGSTVRTFTIFKNGVSTSLSVAFSGSTTQVNDTVNSVSITAGDSIALSYIDTGGAGNDRDTRYSLVFTFS